MKTKGTLFLIPCSLGGPADEHILPSGNLKRIAHIKHFVVEHAKSARRFLRSAGYTQDFDEVELFELNKHTALEEQAHFVQPALDGMDMGLISDAGCPGVADPGAEIVALAHQRGVRVVPLIGPSSILLTLMASGLNGQSFTFHGYVPKEKRERSQFLARISNEAQKTGNTQLFMDTPYRNMHLFEAVCQSCSPQLNLCVALNVSLSNERIQTKPIAQWKKEKPNLHKMPCMFALGK